MASFFQGSRLSASVAGSVDGSPRQPSIYVCSGDLNFAPLVCIAHTAEPSPQPFFKANLTNQNQSKLLPLDNMPHLKL